LKTSLTSICLACSLILFAACSSQPAASGEAADTAAADSSAAGGSAAADPASATGAALPERVIPVPEYRAEISASGAGYSFLVNNTELSVYEGSGRKADTVILNEWLLSGENEITLNAYGGAGSLNVAVYRGDALLHRFTGQGDWRFTPSDFPILLTEKAESVPYVLPNADQQEITAVINQLRSALASKNTNALRTLLLTKYTDIAKARGAASEDLLGKRFTEYNILLYQNDFAVRPLSGHYSFHSMLADKVVKVTQGATGFPQPAIVITYKDAGGKAGAENINLYFAKINGKWVIIR
jgi:hypothetical protein